jgi:hypothetical protein
MSRRRRNVLREIRHGQRDPRRVRLKPTAPLSRDPRQLLLPNTTPPLRPAPADSPWPEHQIDLEECIAALKEKEKQP